MAKTKPDDEKDGTIGTTEGTGATDETGVTYVAGDTAVTGDTGSTTENAGTSAKDEPQVLEEVRLVDWPQEREGIHTVHTKDGIFSFINGKAEFKAEVASKLREAGYIE